METRQVIRARERREAKESSKMYPHKAQKGGPTRARIHKNRKHRSDGEDYFVSTN